MPFWAQRKRQVFRLCSYRRRYDYNSAVATSFHFDHAVDFAPERADEILRTVPALPGVFALRGPRAEDSPYLTHTTDLRRRMRRLLDPPESQSKRLNLREKVARIEYCVTGSSSSPARPLRRNRRALRIRRGPPPPQAPHPVLPAHHHENAFPRVYATNRLSKRGLAQMYGPFPSRLAAERYCDAVLDLFKLRRCYEDLAPYPEHPGCVYGEMKKCLEPCKQACTPEQYAAEAAAVKRFFDTRGESMVIAIGLEREEASAAMEFEKAAALHAQWQKVKAAQALADWIVRPVPRLRAVIVQPRRRKKSTKKTRHFSLEGGCLVGPERLSTLGVRAVREQTSVGSSLFAQPLMLQAVPLEGEATAVNSPEDRAAHAIKALEEKVGKSNDLALLSDHLSLLRRWYYRPEKQRVGEIFFANEDGTWPIRKILRGAARIAIGEPKPMAETQRDAAKAAKTKILHEGRPEVERTVPVLPKDH